MRHDPVIVASPPKARGPKTLASGVRASGSRVRGHPSSAAACSGPLPSPGDSPAICFMNVMQTPSAPRTPPFTSSRTNHTNCRREEEG